MKRCLYLSAALPRESGALPACVFEKPVVKAASDYIIDYDALFGSVVYELRPRVRRLADLSDLWETVLDSMKSALSHVNSTGEYDSTKSSAWNFLDWQPELHKDAGMHGL